MASSLLSAPAQPTALLCNPLTGNRFAAFTHRRIPAVSHRRIALPVLPSAHSHRRIALSKPKHLLPVSPLIKPSKRIFACSTEPNPNPARETLTGSTRTFATIGAVALAASKLVHHGLFSLAVQVREPVVKSAGPAFFAAVRSSRSSVGSLNTPLTVVAAGMAKWLDIYRGILMIRCMLSMFQNIPWDKQPLSAIRDLCDPFLNLFSNIIPPIAGGALDLSSLLAFAVLGMFASILNSAS